MTRLPTVGGDTSAWGTLLNTFLQVGHNADGSLKGLPVFVDVLGADNTGAADSTVAFQNALASLPSVTVYANPSNNTGASAVYHKGTLVLGPGTYKLGSSGDIGNVGPLVSIIGPGHNACKLDYHGSGDCLRVQNAVNPTSGTFDTLSAWAGKLDGFTIDGTNAGAGALGLHYGDTEGGTLGPDLYISHFNKSGSAGAKFDNQVSWTENNWGRIVLNDNTNGVVFNVGAGASVSNSFEYNDLTFKVYANANQNGVVLQGGAYYGNGKLRIFGNFALSGSAQTSSCLTITGSQASTGIFSIIVDTSLDIQVETNAPLGGGGNAPTTITWGNVFQSGMGIYRCLGILNFSGTWVTSNWSVANSFAQGNFTFAGHINGDANLSTAAGAGFKIAGPIVYPLSQGYADGGFPMRQGDFFPVTLAQNMTVNFQFNIGGPQRKTFLIQQAAAGGPYTVTWPKPGSPSVGSPAVYWAGGTAPTMSTGANAIDLYVLETVDGIHWYGRATQNLS